MKNLIKNTCISINKFLFYLFNFTTMLNKNFAAIFMVCCVTLFSCNNNDNNKSKKDNTSKDTVVKKDEAKLPAEKAPIINIFDTIATAKVVICMKDSSATMDGIGKKLAIIYGKIGKDVLAKNKLTPIAPPMAWYKSEKAPYFFEAGMPVAKAPAKLPSGMFIKEIKTDSITVAHFFGPYNLLFKGYDAIKERLKDEKKTAKGMPYEIYVGDPMDANGNLIDAYKVRTDIVFPWH
jgi:effector-binding domain-containing protein